MKIACIFPGQGSQAPGMGKDLADNFGVARDIFAQVDDALNAHLSKLMFDGSAQELTMTHNAQPALMAVSVAVFRVMAQESDLSNLCRAMAGHSLGEYSALCCAGTLDLADCARLLRLRGEAMQQAVPANTGAMAAIIGLDEQGIKILIDDTKIDGEVLDLANDNAPGQIVISGHIASVENAIAAAKEHGAKMAVKLPVSAPFHCSLMQPARDAVAEALEGTHAKHPDYAIYANVSAKAENRWEDCRELLIQQVCGQVRWRESMQNMIGDGFDHFIELGAGKVLTGLMKRIDKSVACTAVNSGNDITRAISDIS